MLKSVNQIYILGMAALHTEKYKIAVFDLDETFYILLS